MTYDELRNITRAANRLATFAKHFMMGGYRRDAEAAASTAKELFDVVLAHHTGFDEPRENVQRNVEAMLAPLREAGLLPRVEG